MNYLTTLLILGLFGGFLSAGAALYGRYYDLPAWLTGPRTCKLAAGGCQVLFRTKNAALFGPPNALLGLVCYFLIAVGLYFGWPLWLLWLGVSTALLMSLRLGYNLLKNNLECRICWVGHFSNLLLWLALTCKGVG